MAITELLQQILSARYGRDVRQSIHDAIRTCYDDGKAGAIDLTAREQIEATKGDITTLQGDTTQLKTDVQTIGGNVETLESDVDQLNKDLNGFAFKTEDGEKKVYNPTTEAWEDFGKSADPYELPIASETTLGGVKVDGTTVTITEDGTISAVGSQDVSIDTSGESFQLMTQEGTLNITKIEGKSVKSPNLLKVTATSRTINGVTFTVNSDKSISLSGTATSTTTFDFPTTLENGVYKLIGCPSGGVHDSTYEMQLRTDTKIYGFDVGNGAVVTCDISGVYNARIRIGAGTVCNNLVFKPMLTTDTSLTYDDYMPYGIISAGENGSITINEHNDGSTSSKTVVFPLSAPLRRINDIMDVVDESGEHHYIGSVDLSSLSWSVYYSNIRAPFAMKKTPNNQIANMVSENFTVVANNDVTFADKNLSAQLVGEDTYLVLHTNDLTVPKGKLIYELAVPTTTPLTSTQESVLNSLVTYNGKTFIDTTDEYAKATLYINNKGKGLISDEWKNKGYSVNDLVIYNNRLYKCILFHSFGIVPTDTTYWEQTFVGNELSQLNNDLVDKLDTIMGVSAIANTTFTVTSTKDFDTITVVGQIGGKSIFDIIVIHGASASIKHIGEITSITVATVSNNSVRITTPAYTNATIKSERGAKLTIS